MTDNRALQSLFMTKLKAEVIGLTGTSRGRERGLVGSGGRAQR